MGRVLEVIVVLSAWLVLCRATHFRGASITWRPIGNKVHIDFRISWRRSEKGHFCDATTQANGTVNSEGDMRFIKSTDVAYSQNDVIGPMAYKCTDFSIKPRDVTTGRGEASFVYKNDSYYEFGFIGCCWISGLNVGSDGSWQLRAIANMTVRSDTGRINSSPTVDIPPVVRLQHGCHHEIRLPVSDPDDDIVRCRWSITAAECSDVCDGLPNASLQDSCTISYAAIYGAGWYAVAVQVEDYPRDLSSLKPLSSVPLQFMVYVENKTSCENNSIDRPRFVPLTLPDKACVGVAAGANFDTDIAIVSGAGNSIAELTTISPLGFVKTALQKVNKTAVWHISVNWNPSSTDVTHNDFCFTAVDDTGLQSLMRCITLLAKVPPPVAIPATRTPATPTVQTDQRQWSIEFDQHAVNSTRSAYIYLYSADGTLVEAINVYNASGVRLSRGAHGTILHFRTTADLQPDQTYYFLLGHGLVQGTSYCGAGSMIVADPNFWRFTAREKVEVKCYRDAVEITCDPSSLYYCKENWNIYDPCGNAGILAGETKFSHPSDNSMFIMCDKARNMYLGYCPSGEVFDAGCRQCAPPGQASTARCDQVLPSSIQNPCTGDAIYAGHTLFSAPDSSSQYIHCDVWGHPYLQTCPGGQRWSQADGTCRTVIGR